MVAGCRFPVRSIRRRIHASSVVSKDRGGVVWPGYLSEIQAVIPAQIHRLPVGADGGRHHIAAIGIGCDLRDSRDARIGAYDAKIVIDPAAILAFCRIPASVELVVVSRIVQEDLAPVDGWRRPYSTGRGRS